MSETLATLTGKLQALLMDDGTLFDTTACTAAIRQALKNFNLRVPVHAAATIEAVADQYVYELTQALAGATPSHIVNVLRQDPAGGDCDVPLIFKAYSEDERWFVRLGTPESGGRTLIVQFVQRHTISGLDGEVETTLTDEGLAVLLDGAAMAACMMAAAGKAEANNVDPTVPESYRKAGAAYESAFQAGLRALSRRHLAQKAQPEAAAWNDRWHAWN
jgi:hypothetical protein